MSTLISKKVVSSKDTVHEVNICYGGEKWVNEIDELFPFTKLGCINFGYWEHVPDFIPIELREKSQLDLYHKLIEFAEIDRKSSAKILEVGCGRGHGVNLLHSKGHDTYGVDLVEGQIKRCIENYPYLKPKFKKALSNNTGLNESTFDFVISVEAAQHFHCFFSFAREGYRILKNGGKIAITTFFYPDSRCKKQVKEILPEDVSGTHRAIQIHKAEKFLKKAGFQKIEIESIGSKTFNGFCKWAANSMTKKDHSQRWVEAYERNLLDYYVIKAEKQAF